MKKKITLHKSNEMTRGGDKLSIHGKRLVKAINYIIKINVNKGKKKLIEKLDYIPIEFPYLRKMLGLENTESYIKEIEEAFSELQKPIQLNNFKNPRDGQLYNWYSISMVSEASWKIDNNKKIAYVSLAPLIKWLMVNTHDGGNFTRLDLIPTINKLRTKYSMKLYEYLKSFNNYRYLDITQKHLMRLFGLDENSKYKFMSDLTILLDRQLKELAKKSDLTDLKLDTSKELRKEKKFRIYINPKSKKKTPKQTLLDTVLDDLTIKRF